MPALSASDCLYEGQINLPDGRTVKLSFPFDDSHGAPWTEFDGHGPVRTIRDRSEKRPGERILGGERRNLYAYDFKGAMQIAKRDGWGLCDDHRAKLEQKLGRAPTAGEIRAAAVERDFDFLSGWVENRWTYIVIWVALLDQHGNEVASDCLGGVESCGNHYAEQAAEMANDLIERHDKELAESAYWLDREVVTV